MEHHAYYIEGSPAEFEALKAELKPFVAQKFERFGIEEARELIALAGLKNFDRALFLIAASSITSEAQQALLKLFEEPQVGTVFVVLIPHGTLLPTLKSRMLPYESQKLTSQKSSGLLSSTSVRGGSQAGQTFVRQVSVFLRASPKERSDMIAKMLKDEEGIKERVLDFVNGLEAELAKDIAKNQQALADIAMVREYLRDRSPSLKILLEHLALVV